MIPQWWSWALTIGDLSAHWIVGSRRRIGWVVAFMTEIGWIWYSIDTLQWGFIVLSLAHMVVFARNFHKWKHTDHAGSWHDHK